MEFFNIPFFCKTRKPIDGPEKKWYNESEKLNIVYEDECLLIINKQPNVAGSILEKHGHSHNDHFKDVSPETNWISVLEHGEKIGIGTMDYELEKL